MQTTVGERIKFLLDHFKLSARKFSRQLGVPENNTQNYLPPNPREPGAYYLEKVLLNFESINAHWLLTGDGDPFSPEAAEDSGIYQTNKKFSRSQVIGQVAGNATQTHGSSATEAAMKREIELLQAQVADKERTIQILMSQSPPR
ncbi:hypothetical protein Q5H92_22730 [Hymenobacter sp. M29]|uniref:XRE family transcriptional regulator n=1 Tax=Hymenobacter mellowenesis TaxID=3063995 RepID=A0ABT9AII3_9BACT|nr:hypothetical protein [Hymenobacter sp. M29]MDO7849197.1 hypothetical protein [Hymenobacter sp. M29]